MIHIPVVSLDLPKKWPNVKVSSLGLPLTFLTDTQHLHRLEHQPVLCDRSLQLL